MNKKMSRYKGLILSCVSMMMIVVCVCSFSFESKAADYNVNISRPQATTNSGYIELLLKKKSDSSYLVNVMFWNCFGVDGNKSVDVNISSEKCQLVVYEGYITVFTITSDGRDNPALAASGNSSNYTYDGDWFGYSIVGYRVYGNVGACTTSIGGYGDDWKVGYNDNAIEVYKLTQIYSELVQANVNDVTMINKLNQIYNSVDTVESKLQQLIDLQEESNTWLEKIWNSIQEFLTPDEEDVEESDKLESETNDKTDKLDDLNEQNKTDKVDVDSATNSVEENVDFDSISTFSNIFVYITENEYVLQMLLLVFSVALVSYVLFGKK